MSEIRRLKQKKPTDLADLDEIDDEGSKVGESAEKNPDAYTNKRAGFSNDDLKEIDNIKKIENKAKVWIQENKKLRLRKKCIIYPDSSFRKFWDFIITL